MRITRNWTSGSMSSVFLMCGLGISLSFPLTASAQENPSKAKARSIQIMEITPTELPQIEGKKYADYSLQALDASGALVPIPFQFDEINELGLHHVPGGALSTIGVEGIFDEKDELAFMYRDGGDKASAETLAQVEDSLIAEITVADGDVMRYVYLVQGSQLRSDRDYADYLPEKNLFQTDTWSMQTSPDNILVWTDHFINSYENGKKSFVDVMKVRLYAKVLFTTVRLDNDNVVGKLMAHKDGPVRDILDVKASVKVLGIPFLSMSTSLELSSGALALPIVAEVPAAAKRIKAPVMTATLDYYELDGSLVRAGVGPKEPSIVDQEMSAVEKELNLNQDQPWLALSTQGKGYDGLLTIEGAEESLKQGLTLSALYQDTAPEEDKPERFLGESPELGFHITNLTPGKVSHFAIKLYHVDELWYDNTPEEFVKAILNPPAVSVSAL